MLTLLALLPLLPVAILALFGLLILLALAMPFPVMPYPAPFYQSEIQLDMMPSSTCFTN